MFRILGRDKLDPSEYQAWLINLKQGDQVAIQQFHPGNQTALDFKQEVWTYELASAGQGGSVYSAHEGERLYFMQDGRLCYRDAKDKEWNANPFPARIVPDSMAHWMNSTRLPSGRSMTTLTADAPIYEPLFGGLARHHFLLEHGPDVQKRKPLTGLRYYTRKVWGGVLIVVFAGEPPNLPYKHLFSEYVD